MIIWCWSWPKIEHRDVFRARTAFIKVLFSERNRLRVSENAAPKSVCPRRYGEQRPPSSQKGSGANICSVKPNYPSFRKAL